MNDPLEGLGPLPEPSARFEEVAGRLAECEREDPGLSLAALGIDEPPTHLGGCAACRKIYQGRRQAVAWLALLPTSQARFPVRRASWKRAALAAAALLALSLNSPRPSGTPEIARPLPLSVRLAQQLEDPDEESFARAALQLGRDCLSEIRALGAYLGSQTASDRRYVAVRLLVHIGGPAAKEELLKASPDAAVVAGLGDLKSTSAVPRLIEWLARPDLRSAAAFALGRIGDPRAIPALARHGEWSILRSFGEASAAYVRAHPDPAFLALRNPAIDRILLHHAIEDASFRGPLLDAAGPDLLLQALLSHKLRAAALARPVAPLVPRLVELLPAPEAVRALAEMGTEEAWDAIIGSGTLVEALPVADPARLARVLSRWSTDREKAPELARWLPARAEYAEFFRSALSVPEARAAACAAIRRLGDRTAVPGLIPLLRGDRDVALTLKSITGKGFGSDRQAWWRWWYEAGRKS